MIHRPTLLKDLKALMTRLEADLRARAEENGDAPEIHRKLTEEYEKARKAERTAAAFEEWRAEQITQKAAAWILSCVFARFLEDNELVAPPRISGPDKERRQRARDEHELYFRNHPTETDREYLLDLFSSLAALPAGEDIFGARNGVRVFGGWLSGDGAGELLDFFQRIDADTGELAHDFTDDAWDTRFLGDLYQDLSEAARKKYALLQTPDFVEAFILDRTLEPALDEFGLNAPALRNRVRDEISEPGFRMIDPACGPGHFLLGGFDRIFNRWMAASGDANPRVLAQKTLDAIFGVDINPFAVAIARFRLLLKAMRVCGVGRLKDAPNFHIHLACGDSLWHGSYDQMDLDGRTEFEHYYPVENMEDLRRILKNGQYHAVVANPPYITVKDKALNKAYRKRFPEVCYRQYSIALPFMQRIFNLTCENGYTGQITANSFMKREFGKRLIECYLSTIDITHVIDTSGAYIPGHGTPTVILFVRNRKPMASTVRAVMGIKGEPATPQEPSDGLVWNAIISQVDQVESESDFISVSDTPRENFGKHPWSISGGGAAELKELIDQKTDEKLLNIAKEIGFGVVTREDEAFILGKEPAIRHGIGRTHLRPMVEGEVVRDWSISEPKEALWPYNASTLDPEATRKLMNLLWPMRVNLTNRVAYGLTQLERGLNWYEYSMFFKDRYRSNLSIVYSEVATHNHFVLERGGKVFNRTAPVIKLPSDSDEDKHFACLGILNSSVGCFWLKQVAHNKGSTVDDRGARQRTEPFEDFFAFNATRLQNFPFPAGQHLLLTKRIDALAQRLSQTRPSAIIARTQPDPQALSDAKAKADHLLGQMIALQEELDWQCYGFYNLHPDIPADALRHENPPRLKLGERAFEIVLARRIAEGEEETNASWFARHGSTPIVEIPAHWPEDYRKVVENRISAIEENPRGIGLIEQPEYKRRWNLEPWDRQLENALRNWLLDRLESYFDFDGRMNDQGEPTAKIEIGIVTTDRLSDIARADDAFMQVAQLYRDRPDFDVPSLVRELVDSETVPLLPVLRYAPSGMDKRAAWERTWALQRQEDAEAADPGAQADPQSSIDIPVPPKYAAKDFQSPVCWRLRGKLDVPKERWIRFPHCEGEDLSLPIAWAGYDHLQLAGAIAAHFVEVQEKTGGSQDPRLAILLACLAEILPWVKQWHNEIDPAHNLRMGDFYEGFIHEEARRMGGSIEEIRSWTPPRKTPKRGRKRGK